MKREDLLDLWDRARRVVDGSEKQRGDGVRIPVDDYLDPARLSRELDTLRRWPQLACAAAKLREPGDWIAVEILGVPLLVSRGMDGALRAFLNVCRHRGAVLADGCGEGRRAFTCPYHSWTYDTTGALIGRPHEDDFPHVPRDTASLVPVPVASRCGAIWVVPSQAESFDWDGYFGPMAESLEQIGYDARCVSGHQRAFPHPANWKLLVEGALEVYHFQYAHRGTIAPYFSDNAVQVETFGRHQRVVLQRRSLLEAAAAHPQPTIAQFGRHASLLNFFFPCTFLLWNGDHLTAFAMRPKTVDTAETDSFMLVPPDAHAGRDAAHWDTNWDRFWAPLDEDYALGASIQRGLRSGANRDLVYGTNEFPGPQFHRALEECLEGGPSDGAYRTVAIVPSQSK